MAATPTFSSAQPSAPTMNMRGVHALQNVLTPSKSACLTMVLAIFR